MISIKHLLSPVTDDHFIENFWGKQFLVQAGDSARFSELFPWKALNSALAEHRLDYPRLRFAKSGITLARSEYINDTLAGPRLLQQRISALLNDGATLILDAVDYIYPPLRALVQDLERFLGSNIQVNAYAGWGTSVGFDLHWDEHDVIILQIYGRKDWKVYEMSRRFPIKADRALNFPPPAAPLWEGTLEAGHLLYMPRGWWHVATPKAEPTLHLTLSCSNPTGLDLLAWLRGEIAADERFRKDLPRFEHANEKKSLAAYFREQVASLLSDDVIDRYIQSLDSKSIGRPTFALPPTNLQSHSGEFIPNSIASALPRPIAVTDDTENAVIRFEALGRKFNLPSSTKAIISAVLSGKRLQFADAMKMAGDELTREELVTFISNLQEQGLVTIDR